MDIKDMINGNLSAAEYMDKALMFHSYSDNINYFKCKMMALNLGYPDTNWLYYFIRNTLMVKHANEILQFCEETKARGLGYSSLFLAYCYLNGNYSEKNVNKAFEYYEISANLNNPYALHKLGWLYWKSKGVFSDYDRAIDCLIRADKAGLSSGRGSLRYFDRTGIFTEIYTLRAKAKKILKEIEHLQSNIELLRNIAIETPIERTNVILDQIFYLPFNKPTLKKIGRKRYFRKVRKGIEYLKDTVERLQEEQNMLIEDLHYRPGCPGFKEVMNDFKRKE